MALNMDKLKKKSEDLSRSGGGADYDKLQPGKNVRRVLPPKGDRDVFWSEGYVHFQVGPEGKSTVTCLETYGQGKKCPICQYVEQLKKGSKADKQLADRIRRTRRMYINVINRDSEDDTPKVLPVGKTILQPLIDLICDPDYGDITDFEEGRDITITKSGKGLNTEYSVIAKPKPSVASEEMTEDELQEALPDLDALFIKKTPQEIQDILDGTDGDDDDDDEDGGSGAVSYDDMDLDDLIALCEERDIKVPPRPTALKLITLLERYDEENGEDEPPKRTAKAGKGTGKKPKATDDDGDDDPPFDGSDDGENDDDGGEDDDDLQAEIARAVSSRRNRK